MLVANNLRDIPTDTESGKHTLAVRLGDARTRTLHLVLLTVPFVVTLVLVARTPWALVGLLALPLRSRRTPRCVRAGRAGTDSRTGGTGLTMLVWGAVTGLALGLG